MNKKVRPGFTLIELLVVIAIIGVLSTLAIVALGSARQKSRDAKRVADLNQIGKALELYYNDNNAYPTIITPGQAIASGSTVYLAQIPSNPAPRNDGTCTNSNYTYSASSLGNAYTLGACLGGSTGSIAAGEVFISSANGSGVQGCGQSLITDQDGNAYTTVQIGAQCWMGQNMRVGTKIVGVHPSNSSLIEKACYLDLDANCLTDGALYEWSEAMQGVTTEGAQGICPSGWHLPSHDEWTTLERAVCTTGSCATDFPYDTTTTLYRGTTEATKLKPSGSTGFHAATDTLPGNRQTNGTSFNYRGTQGFFWTSTQSTSNAWYRDLVSSNAGVYRDVLSKSYSFSVRCVQS